MTRQLRNPPGLARHLRISDGIAQRIPSGIPCGITYGIVSGMTDQALKIRENRLRRMAERQGLRLVKFRTRIEKVLKQRVNGTLRA